MMDLKFFRIKTSDVVNYDPLKLYKLGDVCIFGGRFYISNFNDNQNNSPILGTKWDQIL
jgi:hypothetical protein